MEFQLYFVPWAFGNNEHILSENERYKSQNSSEFNKPVNMFPLLEIDLKHLDLFFFDQNIAKI